MNAVPTVTLSKRAHPSVGLRIDNTHLGERWSTAPVVPRGGLFAVFEVATSRGRYVKWFIEEESAILREMGQRGLLDAQIQARWAWVEAGRAELEQ